VEVDESRRRRESAGYARPRRGKRDEHDVKKAERDAEAAEEDAADALDYATWAVDQAELAVLDAMDARSWADERSAASPPR
jgi:hypothetical protein